MSRPAGFIVSVALAAGLAFAGCSDEAPTAKDDPIVGFCVGIADANAALRELSSESDPDPGLQAAAGQLDGIPTGTFRDQATLVLLRLEVVAEDGVGPVSGAEQAALRGALSEVSSECTSRGQALDLLQGFSST